MKKRRPFGEGFVFGNCRPTCSDTSAKAGFSTSNARTVQRSRERFRMLAFHDQNHYSSTRSPFRLTRLIISHKTAQYSRRRLALKRSFPMKRLGRCEPQLGDSRTRVVQLLSMVLSSIKVTVPVLGGELDGQMSASLGLEMPSTETTSPLVRLLPRRWQPGTCDT